MTFSLFRLTVSLIGFSFSSTSERKKSSFEHNFIGGRRASRSRELNLDAKLSSYFQLCVYSHSLPSEHTYTHTLKRLHANTRTYVFSVCMGHRCSNTPFFGTSIVSMGKRNCAFKEDTYIGFACSLFLIFLFFFLLAATSASSWLSCSLFNLCPSHSAASLSYFIDFRPKHGI